MQRLEKRMELETAAWVYYEQVAQKTVSVLQQVNEEIEAYAKKPNANPRWVRQRQERLAQIAEFMKVADELLKAADHNNQAHYREGYRRGQQDAQLTDDDRTYREYRIRNKLKIRD